MHAALLGKYPAAFEDLERDDAGQESEGGEGIAKVEAMSEEEAVPLLEEARVSDSPAHSLQ
jgi:hypothetical protein